MTKLIVAFRHFANASKICVLILSIMPDAILQVGTISCTVYVTTNLLATHTIDYHVTNFDVLLTVHLNIFISVINQLNAQNFCFTISLFHASTCFEHMCSKHVEA